MMLIAACALSLVGAIAPDAGAVTAPTVEVTAPRTVIGPAGDVRVRVTLANPTAERMRVLKWDTPAGGLSAPLFDVSRDGQRVEYLGPLVKRAAPTAADYVVLAPGEERSYEVDLTATYAFEATGTYTVRYRVAADPGIVRRAGVASSLVSPSLELAVGGRPAEIAAPAPMSMLTYLDHCTGYETALATAVSAAATYSDNAAAYFASNRAGTRYTTWFGTFDRSRWQAVRSHYQQIAAVLAGGTARYDCAGALCSGGTYAYVYPSHPFDVYLCATFWASPVTGTDSQAGTLVHEFTHFPFIAGTDDYAYGKSASQALATASPPQAVMNADNHEYFAENTPASVDNAPALTVSAAANDFASVAVGTTSAPYTFTVTSTGDTPVAVGTVAVTGDFAITGSTCSGATLAPAATCTISATFTPTAAGSRTGSIGLPSTSLAAPTALTLTGTGVDPSAQSDASPTPAAAASAAPAIVAAARMAVRVQSATRLSITVGSSRVERWTYRIRVRRPDGRWAVVTTARDVPGGAVRIIDLPKGRYQVVVGAANGLAGTTSATLLLRR